MANLTHVLFGNRLYGAVTYEANYDPQTHVANLGETQTSTDTGVFAAGKNFPEAMTLTEALAKLVATILADTQASSDAKTALLMKVFAEAQASSDAISTATEKALAESISMSESRIMSAAKLLVDTLTLSDETIFHLFTDFSEILTAEDDTVDIVQIKGLSEFLILNEWISIVLTRADPWLTTPLVPSTFTLFGQPLYGDRLFATTPTVEWITPGAQDETWTNLNGESH